MERKPPANDDDTPQEAVQDYLDLMLGSPNNKNEPSLNTPTSNVSTNNVSTNNVSTNNVLTENLPQSALTNISNSSDRSPPTNTYAPAIISAPTNASTSITASLSMAASTAMTSTSNPVIPSEPRRQRHGDRAALKPFADPVKPLTLKIPFTQVKLETTTESKVQQQEIVRSPAVPVIPVESEVKPTKTIPKPTSEAKSFDPKFSEPKPSEQIQQLSTTVPVTEDQFGVLSESSPEHVCTSQWLENGRPVWAQERFECLLFSVGGLTLAVPLVELGTIYPLQDELTPIFGQAEWFLGLLSVKGANIRTVNTAKVVMPEHYNETKQGAFSYVITINGVDWGLAVDSVSTSMTLEPRDVKWRGKRGKRPWLAGTVVDKMCALLDVSQLAAMFVQEDKQHR